MNAKHFHKWCIEVLAADFWDVFKHHENQEAQHKVRLLKYHFRQALSQLLVLDGDQPFDMDLNYEDYVWHCPRTIHDYGILQLNYMETMNICWMPSTIFVNLVTLEDYNHSS